MTMDNGSEVDGRGVWALRVPFEISPIDSINLEGPIASQINGVELILDHTGPIYHVTARGFESREEAEAAAGSFTVALQWMGIRADLGVTVTEGLEIGEKVDDPERAGRGISHALGSDTGPVDALLNGNIPVVFGAEWRTRFATGFPASLIHGRSPIRLLEHLTEGLDLLRHSQGRLPEHLTVALELLNAQRLEYSLAARLLMITTVLEVLAPDAQKHESALALIGKWQAELDEERARQNAGEEAASSLDSLERELLFRRGMSLRGRVRQLAISLATDMPERERTNYGRKAALAYDTRSELAHRGHIATDRLAQALNDSYELATRAVRRGLADHGVNFERRG